MRNAILTTLGIDPSSDSIPNEMEELARSGYLAVIHADGNSIGKRSKEVRKKGDKDFFKREARSETFFHHMRVLVRIALVKAISRTFQGENARLPFRLIMLGGDDLLLICDAPFALPFVKEYADALQTATLPDGLPLHMGAGVAIVKKKFPFYRSHSLAEQLAASAKRLDRNSHTVDWLAMSEAWHDDIADVRQRDAMVPYSVGGQPETIILSRKPYRVLGENGSLASLLQAANTIKNVLPRSQLISLGIAIPDGRLQADWELELLRPEWRQALRPALYQGSLWQDIGEGRHVTRYLDFLELVELRRLGGSSDE
jgi:hypothetical protein